MDTETNHDGIRPLSIAVGLLLCGVGGQPLVNYLSGDSSLKTAWPSLATVAVGVVVFLFGVFFRPRPDSESVLLRRLAGWGMSPVPYASAVLLVWVYFETLAIQRNIELATLRNDEQSITRALDRFVLPRQISNEQISMIASFLQNFPAQNFTMSIVEGDEEASEYGSYIERALEKGGWHMKSLNPVKESAQSGLAFSFSQKPENQTPPGEGFKWTLEHGSSFLVVQAAFGTAGVQVDGWGGSGGSEDIVTVTVGHRRRNSYALPCVPK